MLLQDTPSEALIQFCWKTLRKEFQLLTSSKGKPVHIIKPGIWNTNQGPDFLHSHVRMEGIDFHGHVEIHVQGDDWYKHRHHLDPHYNNTVLHVVWRHSQKPIIREDGTQIPECEIGILVPTSLLHRVDQLRLAKTPIPCASMIHQVSPVHKELALTRTCVERITRKAALLQKRLTETASDWGQVLWEEMAARIGGNVNGEAFREIAQRVPLPLWRHYHHDIKDLEALFMGAAGMLPSPPDEDQYTTCLKEKWVYFQHKHQIDPIPRVAIKLMRMRPASFPTLRISQLAALLNQYPTLTPLLLPGNWEAFLKLKISATTYWDKHYTFGEKKEHKQKNLGKSQKYTLLINTLIPLGYLYAAAHNHTDLDSWIEDGLATIPPEHNRITNVMKDLSFPNEQALHSQGIIELYKQHCQEKRCLSCSIGYQILAPAKQTR